MKKVICTILVMVALSTSVSAATNMNTFGTGARNMLDGVTHGSKMYMYSSTIDFEVFVHLFGLEVLYTR